MGEGGKEGREEIRQGGMKEVSMPAAFVFMGLGIKEGREITFRVY